MISELGHFLITLGLTLSVLQLVSGWLAAGNPTGMAAAIARRSSYSALAGVAVAFVLLITLFLQSDFSVAYVANHSHVDKPLFYKIAATWGGHEGSMLLWCLLLVGVGAALSRFALKDDPALRIRAVSIQGGLQLLFLGFLVFASNPFMRELDVPVSGAGLNPILQDPALAIHPPTLYIGYVGLSAAFSLAVAGLIEGRGGRAIAAALRPWALVAWTALTAGISLGAWWAYYELGWGGWWFWDPVENASFMPWLIAAALIHSAIATEKSGNFAGWTAFLAIIAFSMSTLGAFLVRSGVLTSVHAFALDPERGLWILAIMTILAGGGLSLFAFRSQLLGQGDGFALTSREAFIGANNLLLTVVAGTVLIGTLYPLLATALGATGISVGAAYFNLAATPLLAALLILLPLAPFLPWKKNGLNRSLALRASVWILPGVVAGVWAGWIGGSPVAIAAAALAGWTLAGLAADLWQHRTVALASAKAGLAARILAHAGVVAIALGAVADSTGEPETVATLATGERMNVGEYQLELTGVRRADGANYLADEARLDVEPGGELRPQRRFYAAADTTTREVSIRSGLDGDLYVSLGEPRARDDGEIAYEIRASFNPMVWLLGLGAFLIVLGGLAASVSRALDQTGRGDPS
ncbi:heme lyase CcmF/NrfE family subunit [Hyphobacterium sp. HN65]|uniref:Heme lyase CcmF/NrfE family subunit n=1 Tax=Hyphobacterium lacteum TaxID=3116575 RepID=A0ABU7LT14_9PROT|nr:heme lyase CcmF/NrfE family subunit [Hyphobacterium sp. HN65]MEE2527066.1 heme lyase CcmF/NrfE family subunit [Hyphobacterium sp. HN65]